MRIGSEYLEEMCTWLRETKGIDKIDVSKLAEFQPEFDAYKAEQGDFNKVDESDIGG